MYISGVPLLAASRLIPAEAGYQGPKTENLAKCVPRRHYVCFRP
jgi:hypothetical protein